jgi:hypothetical protein
MSPLTVAAAASLSLLTLAPLADLTQSPTSTTPISRARISAAPSLLRAGEVAVNITNAYGAAMEAWVYELTFDTTSSRRQVVGYREDDYVTLSRPHQTGEGAILPGETRRIIVQLEDNLVSVTGASLVVVLFSDGTFQGDPAERDLFVRRRTGEAAELGYWIPVLQGLANRPAPDAKLTLQSLVRSRRTGVPVAGLQQTTAEALFQSLERLLSASDASFQVDLGSLVDRLVQRRALAIRPVSR